MFSNRAESTDKARKFNVLSVFEKFTFYKIGTTGGNAGKI
jgi:hypothetical protein